MVTPNSTSTYHVSHDVLHHDVLHHISVRHHILHPTTYHISLSATSTTTYRTVSQPTLCLVPHCTTFHIPCHSPHCLVPHRTTFHIPCHSTHTSLYYTTTFHNPIRTICDPFCYVHIQPFTIPHIKPNKNGGEKVPEKVIPVCPNTNLF